MNNRPEPIIDAGDEQEVKILLQWIEDNIPKEKWNEGDTIPMDIAMWAMAMTFAEAEVDSMSLTNMASFFLDGITPLDKGDLIDWFADWRDVDDPEDQPPRQLQEYLKNLYGVE